MERSGYAFKFILAARELIVQFVKFAQYRREADV
jgi:hypothetical protein